jgi:hypothetical protein
MGETPFPRSYFITGPNALSFAKKMEEHLEYYKNLHNETAVAIRR